MPLGQDWASVWPVARPFNPSTVPLPIRMGYQKPHQKKAPPKKYINLELMKIPNFLHLTPPAIKKHCDAIKSEFEVGLSSRIGPLCVNLKGYRGWFTILPYGSTSLGFL